MKRYIILLLSIISLSMSGIYAAEYATLGDFLTTYVEHFDDSIPDSYEYIDVHFTNIEPEDELYPILQKAIYLDMIENLSRPLNQQLLITQTSLAQVMQAHRGQIIERSSNYVTLEELHSFVEVLPDYRAYFCGAEIPTYTIDVSDFALTSAENFVIMDDVYQKLTTSYLYRDQLRDRDLIAGAIKGMVDSVGDEYTTYFLPVENEAFQQAMGSEYSGIGVVVEAGEEGLTVISPFRGSPAQKGGLQPGDIITHVDGVAISQMGASATELILGPQGSIVSLTISRDGQTLHLSIIRELVTLQMVSEQKLANGDYYIGLSSFGYGSALELQEALRHAIESHAKKLILDLRHNPGGSVAELEVMLDMFLQPGTLGFAMRGEGYDYEYFTQPATVSYTENELIILIDEGSASAAEMLALILQDHGRAVLVGEQTFGKGIAQALTDYADGSSLKHTIYEWFSLESGTSIDGVGVQPDRVVSDQEATSPSDDIQLEYAQDL